MVWRPSIDVFIKELSWKFKNFSCLQLSELEKLKSRQERFGAAAAGGDKTTTEKSVM